MGALPVSIIVSWPLNCFVKELLLNNMSKYWCEYIYMNWKLFKSKNVVLCCPSLFGIKELLLLCIPSLPLLPTKSGILVVDWNIFHLCALYHVLEQSSFLTLSSLYQHPQLLSHNDWKMIEFCCWLANPSMFSLSVFVTILDWWLRRFIYSEFIAQSQFSISVSSPKMLRRELSSGVDLRNKPSSNSTYWCFHNLIALGTEDGGHKKLLSMVLLSAVTEPHLLLWVTWNQ